MANAKSTDNELLIALQEELTIHKDMVRQLRKEMTETKTDAQSELTLIEEQLKILHDPYEAQRPFAIFGDIPPDDDFPQGQVLRWLNPRLRDSRTMRGWQYLQWGDKYTGENAEKLEGLVPTPPPRMEQPGHIDSYLRRTDCILGRLDKRIWVSRQLKRELECARRRGYLESTQREMIAKGVSFVGEGLKRDEAPKSGLKPRSKALHQPFDRKTGIGSHRTEMVDE